ncbi:S8 family serine peptidase [Sphingomicrobium arenosum]|uniref:S8 family serine peptidase n=1 Tax=Sphingomicrobium arenosum TaxID=2233861 RepID=UPI002240EED3|nr:S8 family serine peptidase [Sphingomicrobium arenosum]
MIAYTTAAVSAVAMATAAQAAPARPISGQYICTFTASVAPGQVRAEAARAANPSGGQVIQTYSHAVRGFAVRLPAGQSARSDMAALKANNAKIKGCERDMAISLSLAPGGKRGGGGSISERTDWGVTRVGGPGVGVSGKTAWVIDSGIDLDHEDLNVDVARSANYVGRDANDENGHGTHVAGTIAAKNGNGVGFRGIAAGAPVVAVRVLDRRGSGSTSGVIAGVDYVAANAKSGDVANMSLGGGISTTLDNAVVAASTYGGKNVYFVLAAGNESDDANNHSPARANGPNVFTVSAIDSNDTLASFSNYGSPVDYAEPGVSIGSTYKDGGYAALSGTSMAAPHLAGILMTMTGANVATDGVINGDRDGNPDPIGVR